MPPSILVKIRRILYLYYLLQKQPTQMLSMFFWTQWHKPCKGDWVFLVQADLKELDIPLDLTLMKEFSKQAFNLPTVDEEEGIAL